MRVYKYYEKDSKKDAFDLMFSVNVLKEDLLIFVVKCNSLSTIKQLIEVDGMDVDEKDNYGNTALMLASLRGKLEIVKYLIKKGAKVDEKDNKKKTATMVASFNEDNKVLKYLADINLKNND